MCLVVKFTRRDWSEITSCACLLETSHRLEVQRTIGSCDLTDRFLIRSAGPHPASPVPSSRSPTHIGITVRPHPTTDATRRFQLEGTTRLLWRLSFEPDERLYPHRMRSADCLVRIDRSRLHMWSLTHSDGLLIRCFAVPVAFTLEQVCIRFGSALAKARCTPLRSCRLRTIPRFRLELLDFMGSCG